MLDIYKLPIWEVSNNESLSINFRFLGIRLDLYLLLTRTLGACFKTKVVWDAVIDRLGERLVGLKRHYLS